MYMENIKNRIAGCLMGQLCGDALGAQVEFKEKEEIRDFFDCYTDDNGNIIIDMYGGGTFGLAPGQITDDSEMAIALAKSIVENNGYDSRKALDEYKLWKKSKPFDIGMTISNAMEGRYNHASLANGAMMRVSPLAALNWNQNVHKIADDAMKDCSLTHVNSICQKYNALYSIMIALLIQTGNAKQAYQVALDYAKKEHFDCGSNLMERAKTEPHYNPIRNIGFVEIAFQNAIYCLFQKKTFEEAMTFSVLSGGDTDTNAAIAGALYGAMVGIDMIPMNWKDCIMQCKPVGNMTYHPRHEMYWPCKLMKMKDSLIDISCNSDSDRPFASNITM